MFDVEKEVFKKNELISKGAAAMRENFQCYTCSLLNLLSSEMLFVVSAASTPGLFTRQTLKGFIHVSFCGTYIRNWLGL